MKEDMKILESECHYLEELGYLRENNHFIRFNQALENLIKGYRELEEKNEQSIKAGDLERAVGFLMNSNDLGNYIPKSVIKEKIDKKQKQLELLKKELQGRQTNFVNKNIITGQIQVLQELLEKRKIK